MQNFCLPVVLTDVRTGLSFHCWYASRDQYTAKITNTTKTTSHNNLSRINKAPSNMYEIPPMVALAAYSKTVCFPALEEEKEGIHFLMLVSRQCCQIAQFYSMVESLVDLITL